ncbi:hydantoin racemase [Obelidium mucronatum]|nr:hydantoin racemase [Obelidium mucronatum]
MRIALFHALKHSPPPIISAFEKHWPRSPQLVHILDDSLPTDLSKFHTKHNNSETCPRILSRFHKLSKYVIEDVQASGILFTCSAFGPYIDSVKAKYPNIPMLKPNEAALDVIRDLSLSRWRQQQQQPQRPLRVAILASFAPTLPSMKIEVDQLECPLGSLDVSYVYVPGAMEALNQGDFVSHDRLVANKVQDFVGSVDVVLLSQFSMERAAPSVEKILDGRNVVVLTTPGSAVLAMKKVLEIKN